MCVSQKARETVRPVQIGHQKAAAVQARAVTAMMRETPSLRICHVGTDVQLANHAHRLRWPVSFRSSSPPSEEGTTAVVVAGYPVSSAMARAPAVSGGVGDGDGGLGVVIIRFGMDAVHTRIGLHYRRCPHWCASELRAEAQEPGTHPAPRTDAGADLPVPEGGHLRLRSRRARQRGQ